MWLTSGLDIPAPSKVVLDLWTCKRILSYASLTTRTSAVPQSAGPGEEWKVRSKTLRSGRGHLVLLNDECKVRLLLKGELRKPKTREDVVRQR